MDIVNRLEKFAHAIDKFQHSHAWAAFPYAVIKKYGDDNASNHGVLITYYAFLSLFPLLFAVTASLQLLFRNQAHVETTILTHIDSYFPLIGSQLQGNIKSVGKTGLALAGSVAIALYGAHGAADAVRQALDKLWGVPKRRRTGFPKSVLKSLVMVSVGGTALIAAAIMSSYATTLGHGPVFKIVSTAMSFGLLLLSLFVLQRIGLSARGIGSRSLLGGALIAAVGLQLLQTFGGYFMTHELQQLNSPYGAFSVTLGLLFWIYLQVEVLLYAIEASTVRSRKLWPRRIFE